MKVGIFFTFDYSLETWSQSGVLERELRIYTELKNKFDIEFVLFTFGNESDLQFQVVNEQFNVIPIYTKQKFSNSKFMRFVKSLWLPIVLKKEINQIDILHQHQLLGSWIPILIKLIFKKPLLVRTGYDMEVFARKDQKNTFIITSYKILNYLTVKICDMFTVTSNSDYDRLKKYTNSINKKLQLRPNWVEVDNSIKPINSRYKNRILAVGRLAYQKNFKLLIEEFKNTSKFLQIDIVGSGYLHNELEQLAIKNNVKVNFIGNLKFDELLKSYQDYLFYFSTSLFEGNPKSLLEAMGSGCIVVASNIPNNSEIIEHAKTGYLFDFENPNLSNLYEEIKDDFNNAEYISKNAKKFIKENNNIHELSQNMYLDYCKLVN